MTLLTVDRNNFVSKSQVCHAKKTDDCPEAGNSLDTQSLCS